MLRKREGRSCLQITAFSSAAAINASTRYKGKSGIIIILYFILKTSRTYFAREQILFVAIQLLSQSRQHHDMLEEMRKEIKRRALNEVRPEGAAMDTMLKVSCNSRRQSERFFVELNQSKSRTRFFQNNQIMISSSSVDTPYLLVVCSCLDQARPNSVSRHKTDESARREVIRTTPYHSRALVYMLCSVF